VGGESRAASESLSEPSREGGESSKVLGTSTHRLRPSASFAFLHLLPIFLFQISNKQTQNKNPQNRAQERQKSLGPKQNRENPDLKEALMLLSQASLFLFLLAKSPWNERGRNGALVKVECSTNTKIERERDKNEFQWGVYSCREM